MRERLLIVQVAALGSDFLRRRRPDGRLAGLGFRDLESVFPALTCTVQASLRTGTLPARHGVVGNGYFDRALHRPLFWEQSADLCRGERIWGEFRRRGGRVGSLFWQQSLGRDVDLLLSPAPIHKHHGGIIEDCFCRPDGLYTNLCEAVGRPFRLRHYWGPLAAEPSTRWIAEATCALMARPDVPDLLLTYLPHLDYDLQRFGPDSTPAAAALDVVEECLGQLHQSAAEHGFTMLVFSDYAITSVTRPVYPNQALRQAGLQHCREVRGMLYPDLHTSSAFAVVDHQIAHVVCSDSEVCSAVSDLLSAVPGVAEVLDHEAQEARGIRHARSGDLVLVAEADAWFAYPWWTGSREAPDYAAHVDIHNKPGYDPGELFFGSLPLWTSQDNQKIKGSHGRAGPGPQAVLAATVASSHPPETVLELAAWLRQHLSSLK